MQQPGTPGPDGEPPSDETDTPGPQEIVEDAIDFFGEDDDTTPPVSDADAPPPG